MSIPASLVGVSDRVAVGSSGEMHSITKVGTTIAKGAYAPFTPSGRIMVNSVLASNYVSLLEDKAGVEIPFTGNYEIPMQWIAHTFKAPHRMLCSLNFDLFC